VTVHTSDDNSNCIDTLINNQTMGSDVILGTRRPKSSVKRRLYVDIGKKIAVSWLGAESLRMLSGARGTFGSEKPKDRRVQSLH
jgi:hypothetical protein